MPEILGQQVGSTGFGLMGLTWRTTPISDEQAFAALRAALAAGCNLWNGGEIYGSPQNNSLHLLNKYFTKYPEDASKVVLSIKGGIDMSTFTPDGSPEGIAKSVGNCVKILDGKKKIDIFECARVDQKTPLEVTLKALEEQVKAGNIGGIGLSEVSAATIRKAAKVTKIIAVEAELSLWSLDVFSNDVAKTAAELDIPIVAYSPIGRGMLTGELKSPNDIPEGDLRRGYPRFSAENFEANLDLVRKLQTFAEKKGCTPAQLAIGWVRSLSKKNGNPVIIPIPGASTTARVNENSNNVDLSSSEQEQIDAILKSFEVVGERYDAASMHVTEL